MPCPLFGVFDFRTDLSQRGCFFVAASIKKLHADTGLVLYLLRATQGHDDAIKTLMRGFKVRLVAKDVLAEAAELAR